MAVYNGLAVGVCASLASAILQPMVQPTDIHNTFARVRVWCHSCKHKEEPINLTYSLPCDMDAFHLAGPRVWCATISPLWKLTVDSVPGLGVMSMLWAPPGDRRSDACCSVIMINLFLCALIRSFLHRCEV